LLEVDDLAVLERPYPDVVIENSLSEIIAQEGAGAVPPFFMVQGNADETVPAEQAIRACNAIGGNASTAGGVYDCGNDSFVAMVDGAGHNLDRRCAGGEWPGEELAHPDELMDTVCPSDETRERASREAAAAAFEWLQR